MNLVDERMVYCLDKWGVEARQSYLKCHGYVNELYSPYDFIKEINIVLFEPVVKDEATVATVLTAKLKNE